LVLQRGEQALGLFNFSRTSVTVNLSATVPMQLQTPINVLTQQAANISAYELAPYASVWLTAHGS
jgi:hypothetical protein